jgi:tape measure domain-containing protein
VATELGTAYVSIVAETSKLEAQIKQALEGGGKQADLVGKDIGKRISKSASKAMKDGWRPDQDIMAGIPDTKLDRIGARIGQVIGKGVVGGLRAKEAGVQFGRSFAQGAGSVGLGGVISRWRQELGGQGALNSIGMLAGKTLSAGLTAGVGVGVAGIGLALTKGFERLEKIDSAKGKLKSLGMSASQVADTVKTVTDSVTGTPYSLDAAFSTAVQAIGAGTKDVGRFMKDVTDAAGFAGDDLAHMGLVFTQILTKGKADGGDLMQLMEAGLPAKSWISESYNLTSDQFEKMQRDGEITLDMLQKSIEDHAPGMAKAAGDTLQGSIGNMQTAIARVGADFLSAIFGGASGDPTEGMKDAIQRLSEMLNNLDGWIKAHRDDIRDFFTSAKDAAKTLVDTIGNIISFINDIPGGITTVVAAFAAWKTIEGVIGLVSTLKSISTLLAVTLPADAAVGAGLISSALAGIAIPAALITAGGLLGGASFSSTMDALGGDNTPEGRNAKNQLFSPGFGIPGAVSAFPATKPPTEPDGRRRKPGHSNATDPTGGLLQGTLGGGSVDIGSLIPGMGIPGVGGGGKGFTGAEGWRPAVQAAIAQYGPKLGISNSKAWEDALIRQIQTESGGNPMADNPNDSNGQGGRQHVTGLLQFLPETFASHNISGGGYTDPNAQIAAALDYVTKRYGMDKNGAPLQIGRGVGYDSGGWLKPGVTQAVNNTGQPEAVFTQSQLQDMRTAGAIPAAAGATNKSGTSAISGVIDMGGEVINGLIDQAASAASTAASVGAMTAGAPVGGGAAAGTAIGLGTDAAKRGIKYGFDLLGIGADALMEQLSPFGQPRFLNQDYTGFVPQQQITGALGNLMSGGAQQAADPTGSLLDPKTKDHGTTMGALPGPGMGGDPTGGPGAINNLMGNIGPQSPDPMISDANSFLSTQLASPDAPPPGQQPMFKIDNVYTQDVDSLGRELGKQGRLAAMQYTNRPAG